MKEVVLSLFCILSFMCFSSKSYALNWNDGLKPLEWDSGFNPFTANFIDDSIEQGQVLNMGEYLCSAASGEIFRFGVDLNGNLSMWLTPGFDASSFFTTEKLWSAGTSRIAFIKMRRRGNIELPTTSKPTSPFIWVPSSAANQVVIFDLQTLQPINGSPFNCCANPSRLSRDTAGNVYISCRDDGRAMKMTPQGQVLWDTNLSSSCGLGLRGTIYVPRLGRADEIYIGCSSADMTFVLNAENGNILETITTLKVYGMAFDGQHIYLSNRYDGKVQAIDIDTNQVVWTNVHTTPYGIAAYQGSLWISSCFEGRACKINPESGKTIQCVNFQRGFCGRGMAISPFDGAIWIALSDVNQVARIDAQTLHIQQFQTLGQESISVDFDAESNLYVINQYSNNTTEKV